MVIAQQLYEGIEIGSEGSTGLITYMRTDSTRVSPDAITEVRAFIREQYGEAYLPPEVRQYRSRETSQDAHEAVRPTSVARTPSSLKGHLDADQYRDLRADLAALRGVPDEPGARPDDDRRDHGGTVLAPRVGEPDQVRRLRARLRHDAHRGDRPGGEQAARAGGEGPARPEADTARAALHRAAAPLHRGDAGEDARGEGDRQAEHLRDDRRHDPVPRLRHARPGEARTDRVGDDGLEAPREDVRGCVRRRVHREAGDRTWIGSKTERILGPRSCPISTSPFSPI